MRFNKLAINFNPFGILIKTRAAFFESYQEAYEYVFEFMRINYPDGYVDLVLLICELTKITEREATAIVRLAIRSGELKSYYVQFNFETPNRFEVPIYKAVFVMLHSMSGTALNEEMFNKALKKHILEINKDTSIGIINQIF